MSEKKYKSKKQIKVFNFKNFMAILLCLIIGGVGVAVLTGNNALSKVKYEPIEEPTNTTDDKGNKIENPYISTNDNNMSLSNGKLLNNSHVLNIMLFGADKAEGNEKYGRSDTMIMLSIDTVNKELKLTSFMRDSYVDIPGYMKHRLNSSYTWGGPALAIQTIESNFGINIDRYAVVDFKSFRNIINVLGGIDIKLTQEEIDYINWQLYKNNQSDTQTHLKDKPGIVHLNGLEALWYSRNRGDSEAGFSGDDFDRIDRQKNLLSILVSDMKKASIAQLIEIVGEIGPMVTTNLKKDEITFLVANALKYLNYDLIEFNVPSDGCWEYYTTEAQESVIRFTDWTRQRYELGYFIYEDNFIRANPDYEKYLPNKEN